LIWGYPIRKGVERRGGRRSKNEELRMRNEEVRINADKWNTRETK